MSTAVKVKEPQADASGDAAKPPVALTVDVATQPPVICPETNEPCLELPQCDLRRLRNVYCVRWVKRIRAEAAAQKGGRP